MKYELYCDGACSNNGGLNSVSGWAFIINDEYGNFVNWDSGIIEKGTNNIGEMTAILKGLNCFMEIYYEEGDTVTVYSDSAYIINCYNQKWINNWKKNGWKTANKTPVKNRELWEELDFYFNKDFIDFIKVKGHAGIEGNEKVDTMAKDAIEQHKKGR